MINHAVFGLAAFRTPTSVRHAAPDRPIERGPVSASLSAGDYFAQYRLDHFSSKLNAVSRNEMASAFGAPALGNALVVISGFYRLPRRETRMGLLSTHARASGWNTQAVPSNGAPKAPPI